MVRKRTSRLAPPELGSVTGTCGGSHTAGRVLSYRVNLLSSQGCLEHAGVLLGRELLENL